MIDRARDLLRFITCGSVDDGKSTLIGRLLYDTGQIATDQLSAVEVASRTWGTQNGGLDFALVTDGLSAEREQGITIDVAYRHFSTARRRFIVADTPGHEQYTRNMVTGASTSELAVILVDARKGVLTQTRRHAYLVRLLGIRHVVLAVNKMDLVEFERARFEAIAHEFTEFGRGIDLQHVVAMPIVALAGDNLFSRSTRLDWYGGPTLLDHLEAVAPDMTASPGVAPLRLPVQWISRPHQDFRGYAGTIESGRVRVGDAVQVQPSGRRSSISGLLVAGDPRSEATAGQAVTVTLSEDIDVSRGDVLSAADEPLEVSDQFDATIVWMSESPMLPGRHYALKLATAGASATITELKHKVNVSTLERLAAKTLQLNEIGACKISLDRPVAFATYERSRTLGGFILVDPISNDTVAAGMMERALRRSHNIHWQAVDVHRAARAEMKQQQPTVVWFTGLSGAGKSTIANLLEKRLFAMGRHTYLLDGDNVRHGLCRDLGFSDADRVENIRRIAEVARLMADAGLIVLAAFISPFRAERAVARRLLGDGEFVEVYVDASLDVAETRDVKGLYRKARRGEISNFTGVNSPYEPPLHPELHLQTDHQTPEEAVDRIVNWLLERRRL